MSARMTVNLQTAHQGHPEILRLWHWAKAQLKGGTQLTVTAQPASRSLDQNAKFHAICQDLERAGVEWGGKARSAAEWKVLLVSGHAVHTKEEAEVIEGIEGELINLRESTAAMSKARGSSLIEYSQAFCAQFVGEGAPA